MAELLGPTVGTAGRGTFVCDNPFGGDDGTIKPLRGAIADIGRLRPNCAIRAKSGRLSIWRCRRRRRPTCRAYWRRH
ncbi:MAG: hypothetical protein ABI439_07035 [Rhodospirillales bacterium]